MARPQFSLEKKDEKTYVNSDINNFMNDLKAGKSYNYCCDHNYLDDMTIRNHLEKAKEAKRKRMIDSSYVFTEDDLKNIEFLGDFAYARSEGQAKWFKPIEDFRDNPKEASRKGSAEVCQSMIKLLYVEYREKKEDTENTIDSQVQVILGSKKDDSNK